MSKPFISPFVALVVSLILLVFGALADRLALLGGGLLIAALTIGYLWEQHRQLWRLVTTDPLTGLANRRVFEEAIERAVAMARRTRRPLALLFIDGDHFKSVNDTFGHPFGDRVLRLLAETIRSQLRPYDLAARLGGEEFAVILPGASHDDAVRIAERLRVAVARESTRLRDGFEQTVSLATMERGDLTADALVDRTDRALYCAKYAGRNRVVTDWNLATMQRVVDGAVEPTTVPKPRVALEVA